MNDKQNELFRFNLDTFIELIDERINLKLESHEPQFVEKTQTILNLEQAASFLGVCTTTLYLWRLNNKIRYRKKGKRIFFIKEELLEDLEQHNIRRVG